MKYRLLNDGWEFTLSDTKEHIELGMNTSLWREVKIPHDWSVEYDYEKDHPMGHRGGFLKSGIGWYRKFLYLEKEEIGKASYLYFDGVYHQSTVYVNGTKYDGRKYGYIGFTIDVIESLHEGMNYIAVRVDCSDEPSSRWYNGCGINRDVFLLTSESDIFVPQYGMKIVTKKEEASWKVAVELQIVDQSSGEKDADIHVYIKDAEGQIVAKAKRGISEVTDGRISFEISLDTVNLWSTEDPQLYTCESVIETEGERDVSVDQFGFRTIEFVANKGMYLNGVHTKLKGMCLHHDAGCLGAAAWEEVWKKRLLMLKEMGCNAIRTTSNPYPSMILKLCDELGLLVMDECFDGWDVPKAPHDYGYFWAEHYKEDLTDFINRDKNHPCIFIWSIGNEVLKMRSELTKELMEIVRSVDQSRLITCGVNDVTEVSDSNRAVLDVAGYNDGGGACFLYDYDHEKRPDQLMIATEAPHTLQTRGFYRTLTWWRDKNQPRMEIPNLTEEEVFTDQKLYYSSSYDNCGVRTCTRDSWEIAETRPFLCGEFRWSGFDYLGEVFVGEFPMRMGNFGIIDTANFPKDHFYLYQSMWTEEPMVHMLPHWTHRYMEEGTKIPIWVYTNCGSAELLLNGKSLGIQERGNRKNLEWMVPYEKGTLEVRAFTQDGTVVSQKHVTAAEPKHLSYEIENLSERMSFVKVKVLDENGMIVPYADSPTAIKTIRCMLEGSDNGCPDDVTHLKSKERRVFNGLGLYVLSHNETSAGSAKVIVGGLFGNRYFDESCNVAIEVLSYLLNGEKTKSEVKICYTLDGSTPTFDGYEYQDTFCLNRTTCVKVKVFDVHTSEELLRLQEIFIKGRPDPVRDEAHLNFEINKERPTGPFSEKVIGRWKAGEYQYEFQENGSLVRYVGKFQETIGYWWYDFPVDCFETPDYAGTGEVWYITGEKNKMEFTDQSCTCLKLDNTNGAMAAAWKKEEELLFTRI